MRNKIKVLRLMRIIKNDLNYLNIDLKNLDEWQKIGIELYIRNTFLWNNERNIKLLQKYYKIEHVDDISVLLLKDAINLKS